jgi:hypothetical protein
MTDAAAAAIAGAICPQVVLKSVSDSALRQMSFCCNTNEVNKMEYLIVFTIVAMMTGYVCIIARCLRYA